MVRIHRNDAPPRQTVNLLSDEEDEQRNFSPTSSDSSNSSSASSHSSNSSSSEGYEKPDKPSPPPLSDFIEEDDQPLPNLKSSSSSWEPVKPRRKPLKTLRKRPRLDKVEADDEDSTSSDSTSSDGIPRPEVEVDADDEDDQIEVETTPTRRTPKKRKRPRRAAAPPCFLDAVNKFVEPMSKEARRYQNLTLRQILYGESDDQEGEKNNSSIEYVPCAPAKVVNVNCESAESDESGENDLEAENIPQHGDSVRSNRKRRHPQQQIRTRNSLTVCISNPRRDEGRNLPIKRDRNSQGYNKRRRTSQHSLKRLRHGEDKSPSDSDTGEQEQCGNEPESERIELRKPNDQDPTGRHRRDSKQDELRSAFKENELGGEVIDLCSDDECKKTPSEDGDRYAGTEDVHREKHLIAPHTVQETITDIIITDLPRPEERFEHGVEDESYFKEDDILTPKVEEPCSFPQNGFDCPYSNRSSTVHDEMVDIDMMEAHKKRESASYPPTCVRQEDTKPCRDGSTRHGSEEKMELQFHTFDEEAGRNPMNEQNKKRNRKQEIDMKTIEDCKSDGLVSKPDPIQTHSRFSGKLGGGTKPDNSTMVELQPRRRFRGAKQRGNMPHPDVLWKRVPQSQEEIQAWLAFAKAEARDIYRALTGEVPAQRYRCATTDMVFMRQILAELGKLMGLTVCSEKDGAGRRIVLEKSPHESVRCSEEGAKEVVARFFYDALADLTLGLSKSKKKSGKLSKKKDLNEPSRTSPNPREVVWGNGEDNNYLHPINPLQASSNCTRRQGEKGNQSPRVVEKVPKRETRSNC